jgi:hypothetical protein
VPLGTLGIAVARMDPDGREHDPDGPVPCDRANALLKLRFLNGHRPGLEAWYALRQLHPISINAEPSAP